MLEGQGKVEEARPIWQRLLQFETAYAGDWDGARCVFVVYLVRVRVMQDVIELSFV